MGNYLLAAGLIFNSLLIIINRFVKRIPDKIYLPGMILGIGLMIAGAIMTNHSA